MGDTISVPGAGECGVLAFALSNADPNYWWAMAPVSDWDGSAFASTLLQASPGVYLQAFTSFKVDGDAVRIVSAYVRSGTSPTNLTDSHVFHLRGVSAVVG